MIAAKARNLEVTPLYFHIIRQHHSAHLEFLKFRHTDGAAFARFLEASHFPIQSSKE